MNKESKNLGVTKACPECKKVVIRDGNFNGTGSFRTKCPHCKSLVLVQINPKPLITVTKLLIIGAIIILVTILINTKPDVILSVFQ